MLAAVGAMGEASGRRHFQHLYSFHHTVYFRLGYHVGEPIFPSSCEQ